MDKSISVRVEYDADVSGPGIIFQEIRNFLAVRWQDVSATTWEPNIDSTVDVIEALGRKAMVLFDLDGNSYESTGVNNYLQAIKDLQKWHETYNFDMDDALRQLEKYRPTKEQALEAIRARIHGEWDNPALCLFGAMSFKDEDFLNIIKTVL